MHNNIIILGVCSICIGAGVVAGIQSTWQAVVAFASSRYLLGLAMPAPCLIATQHVADGLYDLTIITGTNAQRTAISSIGMRAQHRLTDRQTKMARCKS